jgi:hypothetical protein
MNTVKHQVHNLIILDESGSMESIKSETINGFNEIVQTMKGLEQQFPDQEHFISLVSFNGLGRKTHLWRQPVKDLVQLTASTYNPDASTPLYDAMGITLGKMDADLKDAGAHNVLVTIFTDGEENASMEFNVRQVKKLVEDLRQRGWTFTYIGTDHDVDKVAVSMAINNVIKFSKDKAGMDNLFCEESAARERYSRKIHNKESLSGGFYEKDDQPAK